MKRRVPSPSAGARRRRAAPLVAAHLALGACGSGAAEEEPAEPREPRAAASPSVPSTPTPSSSTRRSPRKSPARRPLSDAEQAELDERLRTATWANDVDRAASLVERGADVNAKDETQQSAYLITTSEGYLDLLNLTLTRGARVDDKDSFNGTGLIRAAERGHALVVGRLLRAGIARNHVNRLGYQAIHEAVWLGEDTRSYLDTIRALVAGGVQLGRESITEGLTPLQMAQQRGYASLESALAAAQQPTRMADPDAVLLRAADAGDADRVARALRAGADIEARDPRRRTPLLLAVARDRVDAARLLVAMGADPDARDEQRDTPWLLTGVTGSVAMLEALLPAGPDLGLLNRYGGTSLIPASERGHIGYARRVLETGIDVDHVNDLGWTALLEAVILGDGGTDHQEVVRLLLAAGADPSIPDQDGVTALQHARARDHPAVARLLRDR